MESIRFLSTSTIQANNLDDNKPANSIYLTPLDLQILLAHYNQKGLLFHKPSAEEDSSSSLIQHLKTSLSQTLDFFPPLAGRLAVAKQGDGTASVFIDCNNAGAQFIHAVADGVTVADILAPSVPTIVRSFFPFNGAKCIAGVSKPLLVVQVTELVDGVFIACTINHSVVDGTSFWNFFNCWSEVSRGSVHLSKPPFLDRCLLGGSHGSPVQFPLSLIEKVYSHDDSLHDRLRMQERFFLFTRKNIAALKAQANSEIGAEKISSLQAVIAHVWRSVARAQKLELDQDTKCLLHVGLRRRTQPPLPEEYLGNAIYTGTVTLKVRELLDDGLGHAALELNKMIAWHNGEKLMECSRHAWAKDPKISDISSFVGSRGMILIGSSPRFNVYGNDFGWGRPLAVRSGPGNKFDGKITLFPGAEEGSIDVEVCLSPETLQALGNDSEFMAALTI